MKKINIYNKGITLIALIITIIILLILVGITINTLTGSGLFEKANLAKEKTLINDYKEKIELIKLELQMKNSNYTEITLEQIKEELDNEKNRDWVKSTEIIIDKEVEKIKLTTKEGYIFYITVEETEYKGKIGEQEPTNPDPAEETKLPTVKVKDVDTSAVVRKKNVLVKDLFEIEWGDSGVGIIQYSVTGNLDFKNEKIDEKSISDLSELEIGTYKITCKVISPARNEVQAQKEVAVTTLGGAKVYDENNSNEEKEAYAIYSEYDLAYFRDLVNEKGQNGINGKIMVKTIDLINVCSEQKGSWTPIGKVVGQWESMVKYEGIFDGGDATINNLYISSTNSGLGLFGAVEGGTIKNMTVDGSVTNLLINNAVTNNNDAVGGIIAAWWGKSGDTTYEIKLKNLHNKVDVNAPLIWAVGGVAGHAGGVKVQNCSNDGEITGWACVSGVIGYGPGYIEVTECWNSGIISAGKDKNGDSGCGGILGSNTEGSGKVSKCYNKGIIYGEGKDVGGIVGAISIIQIEDCYNLNSVTGGSYVGGICGAQWNNRKYFKKCI